MSSLLSQPDVDVLRRKLNAIVQQIHALPPTTSARRLTHTAELGACISQFVAFFETASNEHGVHAQALLGQHVCGNVLLLCLTQLVVPTLKQYAGAVVAKRATPKAPKRPAELGKDGTGGWASSEASDLAGRRLRQDVLGPFRALVQTLHRRLPPTEGVAAAQPEAVVAALMGGDGHGGGSGVGNGNIDATLAGSNWRGGPSGGGDSGALDLSRPEAGDADRAVGGRSAPGSSSGEGDEDAGGDMFASSSLFSPSTSMSSVSMAPLLWKQASPLLCLCQHVLEVLQSEVLVAAVAMEYIAILQEVLRWQGYVRQLPNDFVKQLCVRLVTLIERSTGSIDGHNAQVREEPQLPNLHNAFSPLEVSWKSPVPTDDATMYAVALCKLFSLPQIASCLADDGESVDEGFDASGPSGRSRAPDHQVPPSASAHSGNDTPLSAASLVGRLIVVIRQLHSTDKPTAALRLEANCLRALRYLVISIQHDHPRISRRPFGLVKLLCNFFFLPVTQRKEVWRLEALSFITMQLCLNFSAILGVCVRVDMLKILRPDRESEDDALADTFAPAATGKDGDGGKRDCEEDGGVEEAKALCCSVSTQKRPARGERLEGRDAHDPLNHPVECDEGVSAPETPKENPHAPADIFVGLLEDAVPGPSALSVLHETILPMAHFLFMQPRHSYSFVSRRELFHPSGAAALRDLFDFGSVVWYLSCATHAAYTAQQQQHPHLQRREDELDCEDEDVGLRRGMKRPRCHAFQKPTSAPCNTGAPKLFCPPNRPIAARANGGNRPAQLLVAALQKAFFVGTSDPCPAQTDRRIATETTSPTVSRLKEVAHSMYAPVSQSKAATAPPPSFDVFTTAVIVQEALPDAALFLLHLISQPATTLHFTIAECDRLVARILVPVFSSEVGHKLAFLLVAALRGTVPRCSHVIQQKVFSFLVYRYFPLSGYHQLHPAPSTAASVAFLLSDATMAESGGGGSGGLAPKEDVYELLTQLVEIAVVGQWELFPSQNGSDSTFSAEALHRVTHAMRWAAVVSRTQALIQAREDELRPRGRMYAATDGGTRPRLASEAPQAWGDAGEEYARMPQRIGSARAPAEASSCYADEHITHTTMRQMGSLGQTSTLAHHYAALPHALSPSLCVSMIRFLAQYGGWDLFREDTVDKQPRSSPALMPHGSAGTLGVPGSSCAISTEKGLSFIFMTLLHACVFYHHPLRRGSDNATYGIGNAGMNSGLNSATQKPFEIFAGGGFTSPLSSSLKYSTSYAAWVRHDMLESEAFAAALHWCDRYIRTAVAFCNVLFHREKYSGSGNHGPVFGGMNSSAWGSAAHANNDLACQIRTVRSAYLSDLSERLQSPSLYVPLPASHAAEGHWLMLYSQRRCYNGHVASAAARSSTTATTATTEAERKATATASSRLSACCGEALPSAVAASSVGWGTGVPPSLLRMLAQAVRQALLLLAQRARIAVVEFCVYSLRRPATAPRGPHEGDHEEEEEENSCGHPLRRRRNSAQQEEEELYAACEVDEGAATQMRVTLAVQCVQFIHLLGRWRRMGVWRPPGERDGNSHHHTTNTDATAPNTYAESDPDERDRDQKIFSGCFAKELFREPADILPRLSARGQIYYALLWACHHLAECLSHGPIVVYQPVLRALVRLFSDVGVVLLSPALACAEPHQTILRMTNVVSKRALEDGVKGLAAWHPCNATSVDVIASIYSCMHVSLSLLQSVLYATWKAKVVSMSTDPLLDPHHVRDVLIGLLQKEELLSKSDSNTGLSASASTGGACQPLPNRPSPSSLHPSSGNAADGNRPQPFIPMLVIPCLKPIVGLLHLLRFLYADQAAREATQQLIKTLFARYRFVMLPDLFAMLGSTAAYASLAECPPGCSCELHSQSTQIPRAGLSVTTLRDEGELVYQFVNQLMDSSSTEERAEEVPLLGSDPLLQCSMLSCIFYVLPRCEASVAEKLGKYSFQFLCKKSMRGGFTVPYTVRKHTALKVHTLFRRFGDAAEAVLHELLFRCREGILSKNQLWCATSLLALAEACYAAPWLEPQVVYTLLECYATQGFVFHPMLLECLERTSGCPPFSPASLSMLWHRQSDRARGRTSLGAVTSPTCSAAYAQLCTYHIEPLLFWWLYRDQHPLEALPMECFGFNTIEEVVCANLQHFVPLATLLLGSAEIGVGNGGLNGRGAAESLPQPSSLFALCTRMFHQAFLPLFQAEQEQSLLKHRNLGVNDVSHPFSHTGEEGASLVSLVLLAYFPEVVSRMLLLSHVPRPTTTSMPRGSRQETGERSLYGIADVAQRSLRWLKQVMDEPSAEQQLSLLAAMRHGPSETCPLLYALSLPEVVCDELNRLLVRRKQGCDTRVAPFECLLIVHTDTILCALMNFSGDALPLGSTALLRTTVESLADRVNQAKLLLQMDYCTNARAEQAAAPSSCSTKPTQGGYTETKPTGRSEQRPEEDLFDSPKGPALEVLFCEHGGCHVYVLLQHLYRAMIAPLFSNGLPRVRIPMVEFLPASVLGASPRAELSRKLARDRFADVCKSWLRREVLRLPHVFRSVVGVCVNILVGCAIAPTGEPWRALQNTVCEVLLHVWPIVVASGSEGGAESLRARVVGPVETAFSATMLALSNTSPVVAATWGTLCRVDSALRRRDWRLLNVQYAAEVGASQLLELAVSEKAGQDEQRANPHTPMAIIISDEEEADDVVERRGNLVGSDCSILSDFERKRITLMLPMLQHLQDVMGEPATTFFREVAQAVGDAHDGLVRCIQQAAACSASQPLCQPKVMKTPNTSLTFFCAEVSRTCLDAIQYLLASLTSVNTLFGSEGWGSAAAAAHSHPCSQPFQIEAMNLLRSLCGCFMDAGEAEQLDHSFSRVESEDDVLGVFRQLLAEDSVTSDGDGESRTPGECVEAFFARLYGQLMNQLYRLSFCEDGVTAALASNALRGWLSASQPCDDTSARGAEVAAGGRSVPHAGKVAPLTPDQELFRRMQRICPALNDVDAAPIPCFEDHPPGDACHPHLDRSVTLPPMCALRPFLHVVMPYVWGPECSADKHTPLSARLLDAMLWQELSDYHNDGGFLPIFVMAAIDAYGLAKRWRVLAAVRPLLEYAAALCRATCRGPRTSAVTLFDVPQGVGSKKPTKPANRSELASRSMEGPTTRHSGFSWASLSSSTVMSPLMSVNVLLLRIVTMHMFLCKESETLRDVRRQWSTHLDRLLFRSSGAGRFPLMVKSFLRILLICKNVVMLRVRKEGLKGASSSTYVRRTSTASAGSGPPSRPAAERRPPYESIFGVIPHIADMKECYWLSDIPAIHLARAAAQAQEPYLAIAFMELSGESLLGPRGGIPSSLMSSIGAGLVDGSVSAPAAAGLSPQSPSFSLLFPLATREHLNKPGSLVTDKGEGLSHGRDRAQNIWRRLTRFRGQLMSVLLQILPLLPLGEMVSSAATASVSTVLGGGASPLSKCLRRLHRGSEGGQNAVCNERGKRMDLHPVELLGGDSTDDSDVDDSADHGSDGEGDGFGDALLGDLSNKLDAFQKLIHLDEPIQLITDNATQSAGNLPSASSEAVGAGDASSYHASVCAVLMRHLEELDDAFEVVAAASAKSNTSKALASYRGALVAAKARVLLSAGLPQTALELIVGSSSLPREDGVGREVAAAAAWRCGRWWAEASDAPTAPLLSAMPSTQPTWELPSAPSGDQTVSRPLRALHLSADGLLQTVLHRLHDDGDPFGDVGADRTAKSFHENLLHALWCIRSREFARINGYLSAAYAALHRELRPTKWRATIMAAEALNDVKRCAEYVKRSLTSQAHGLKGVDATDKLPSWLGFRSDTSQSNSNRCFGETLASSSTVHCGSILDDVHHCLCQLSQNESWYRSFLLHHGACSSHQHQPWHRIYQWLKQYEGFRINRRLCLGSPLAMGDEAQIDLTLLYARALYGIGRSFDAVAVLQQKASHSSVLSQPSPSLMPFGVFTLPNFAPTVPRVVQQIFEWSCELQLAPLSQVVRDPFLSKSAPVDSTGGCSFHLARLCHTLAGDIAARLHTHEYKQLRASVEESKKLRDSLSRQCDVAKTDLGDKQREMLSRRIRLLERDIALEEEQLGRDAGEYALYRRSALNSYARYLQSVVPHDNAEADIHAVFGFTELWLHEETAFEEKKKLGNQDPARSGRSVTDEVLTRVLTNIPAVKFLPCFNQLAAQLGSSRDDERLTPLVMRIACEYPLETIWPLLALCNGQQFGGTRETNALHAVDDKKVSAARSIVRGLRGPSGDSPTEVEYPSLSRKRPGEEGRSETRKMIKDAETLSAAYIELALHRPGNQSISRSYHISPGFKILSEVRGLCIPPPTNAAVTASNAGFAVLPSAASLGLAAELRATVIQYRSQFTTPGGINIPKVIQCELSDGSCVRQLLKSNDDLRQDALIEQVFAMSNLLFARNEKTRALSVFTYKVVPLAPTVGVLQWVDGTVPFGDYLTGSRKGAKGENVLGAHERYFPGEPTTQECAEKFVGAVSSKKEVRKNILLSIYAEFTPALHYFFLESFLGAQEWHEKRRAYTRSAAAASMVGYIVGLGDRHGSNILLHRRTAEVIHIDLGIAFDQNKLLPIPELVPFRLTRNVVDGFGVQGAQGGFGTHCEAALHVLRRRRALLLAILDAFVHDPLARWSITLLPETVLAGKASEHKGRRKEEAEIRRQRERERGCGSPSDNSTPTSVPQVRRRQNVSAADAQRTLARVANKLSGYDGMEHLSVPIQVRKLIQTAQSVDHLSAMFRGWSPWL